MINLDVFKVTFSSIFFMSNYNLVRKKNYFIILIEKKFMQSNSVTNNSLTLTIGVNELVLINLFYSLYKRDTLIHRNSLSSSFFCKTDSN